MRTSKFFIVSDLFSKARALWHGTHKILNRIPYNGYSVIVDVIVLSAVTCLFYLLTFPINSLETKKQIINSLISATSITFAIIISFLFGKLFAERSVRVVRKSEIDKMSVSITKMIRLSQLLWKHSGMWKAFPRVTLIDKHEPELTVFIFRGEMGERRLSYDERSRLCESYGGELAIQTYLSFKGLVGKDIFAIVNPIEVKNYSDSELMKYFEYCSHISYFFMEYNESIKIFNNSSYFQDNIKEAYFLVTGKQLETQNINQQLSEFYGDFAASDIVKMRYLTRTNNKQMPNYFRTILRQAIYLAILLFLLLLQYTILERWSHSYVLMICGIFIGVTARVITSIVYSVRKEITITDFYSLEK